MNDKPTPPVSRKRIVLVGIILACVAAGMYGSIIIKTAMMGP